jgi:hypothetical protein
MPKLRLNDRPAGQRVAGPDWVQKLISTPHESKMHECFRRNSYKTLALSVRKLSRGMPDRQANLISPTAGLNVKSHTRKAGELIKLQFDSFNAFAFDEIYVKEDITFSCSSNIYIYASFPKPKTMK